jgi:hypothetical protein
VAADRHPAEDREDVLRRLEIVVAAAQPARQRIDVEGDVERQRRVVLDAGVELAVPARVVEDAVQQQRVGDRAVGVQRPQVPGAEAALELAERLGRTGERWRVAGDVTIVPRLPPYTRPGRSMRAAAGCTSPIASAFAAASSRPSG